MNLSVLRCIGCTPLQFPKHLYLRIILNSTVKYLDRIPNKLTHDTLHLYGFTFSYFNNKARCGQNKSKHVYVAGVNVNKYVFTNKVCVCLCTSTISIKFLDHVFCKNTIS